MYWFTLPFNIFSTKRAWIINQIFYLKISSLLYVSYNLASLLFHQVFSSTEASSGTSEILSIILWIQIYCCKISCYLEVIFPCIHKIFVVSISSIDLRWYLYFMSCANVMYSDPFLTAYNVGSKFQFPLKSIL